MTTAKKIAKIKRMQIGRKVFLALLCAIVVYPLWMLISVSLSAESDIAKYGYLLIPKKVDFAAYKYVFSNPTAIIDAYKVTFFFSVALVGRTSVDIDTYYVKKISPCAFFNNEANASPSAGVKSE